MDDVPSQDRPRKSIPPSGEFVMVKSLRGGPGTRRLTETIYTRQRTAVLTTLSTLRMSFNLNKFILGRDARPQEEEKMSTPSADMICGCPFSCQAYQAFTANHISCTSHYHARYARRFFEVFSPMASRPLTGVKTEKNLALLRCETFTSLNALSLFVFELGTLTG